MTKKLTISSLIFMSFLLWLSNPAGAATRTALVIGNSNYETAALKNPVNDARDMANVLRALDFDVIERLDADEKEMVKAINEFYKRLKKAEIGLFYFAGHGMQVQGENYLIPVRANVTTETDLRYEAVEANRVLGKMHSAGNKFNIVILDACRDNPFKRSFRTESKGLAQMDAPKGTIIAYATSPGSVAADGDGRNGVYTKHLLDKLKMPGVSVQDVFMEAGLGVMKETGDKQIPWTSSTPVKKYYLASSGAGVYSGSDSGKTLLTVEGNPTGAKVYIDSRYAGTMPLKDIEVSPGEHRLRVSLDGYDDYQKTVRVEKGRSVSMYIDLSPVRQARARLYVDTEPGSADVRILNIVPRFYQGIELDPGRYNVEASASKYEKKEIWVDVAAGEDKRVSIRLEPVEEKTFTNSIGMKFVKIPAGSFMMGSSISASEVVSKYGGKEEWYKGEHPQHQVTISRPFYMQSTEVTVGQWRSFIKDTGYRTEAETGGGAYTLKEGKWEKREGAYWDNPGFSQTDSHPVTCVSWNDAREFIKWLNGKEGGKTYRLPTEAEWEYACRAGTATIRFWGDDPDKACGYANVADQTEEGGYSWNEPHKCKDGYWYPAPVGSFKPNNFGLYDMIGNLLEWCEDWYGSYPSSAVTDPEGPSSGSSRVIRGGSWDDIPRYVRCAYRSHDHPDCRSYDLGFRLMRTN